jgi:hypothetical protein
MNDDWLVSWDGDGAIRLWDQQGKPLLGALPMRILAARTGCSG